MCSSPEAYSSGGATRMPWPSHSGPLVCYVTHRHAFGLEEPQAAARLAQVMARAASAGVDAIQIREKDLSGRALLDLAERAVAQNPNTKILINDRLDIALAAGAAGVHLGSESVPVPHAVRFIQESRRAGRGPANFLVGRSCHALEEVLAAERDGADFVFFGPIFATPAKARFGPPQDPGALAQVCRRARIPVVAIGGITLGNFAACLAAGAAGIAAIRLFQDGEDLRAIVRGLKEG